MPTRVVKILAVMVVVAVVAAFGYLQGYADHANGKEIRLASAALAQGSQGPTKALPDRDVYYPGSEDLAPDEMRVIACGTGMPTHAPSRRLHAG